MSIEFWLLELVKEIMIIGSVGQLHHIKTRGI